MDPTTTTPTPPHPPPLISNPIDRMLVHVRLSPEYCLCLLVPIFKHGTWTVVSDGGASVNEGLMHF